MWGMIRNVTEQIHTDSLVTWYEESQGPGDTWTQDNGRFDEHK